MSVSCACFFLRLPRPPGSTLFPYTTLFRSRPSRCAGPRTGETPPSAMFSAVSTSRSPSSRWPPSSPRDISRSEEHTSELQSRQYLVCRLLLEKKKQPHSYDPIHTNRLFAH